MIGRIGGWLRGGDTPSPAVAAEIPAGERVYAIGDVHGRADLLEALLASLQEDARAFAGSITLIMIGDYIDRGPQSAEVVDILLRGLPAGWKTVFLRGNHEHAMLEFLKDPRGMPMWLAWGGVQALESYGVAPYGAMGLRDPDALAAEMRFALEEWGHSRFFEETVLWHRSGGYAFVHAGVRPGVLLEKQLDDDLLFIREDFMKRPHGLPLRVIFGHTIMEKPLIENDRIGIDTGAFMSGILTAVALEGADVRVIQATSA